MEIKVNGEQKVLDAPMSVGELLRALGVNPKAVAVERNLEILPRDGLERVLIQEGDSIEIIRFVGGG